MITVLGNRLLIKPDPIEKEYEVEGTGIKLALIKNEKEYRAAVDSGVIVGIGPTAWIYRDTKTPWAKLGDRVQYHRYSGKFVVDPETEEEFVVVNDDDIHVSIVGGKEKADE